MMRIFIFTSIFVALVLFSTLLVGGDVLALTCYDWQLTYSCPACTSTCYLCDGPDCYYVCYDNETCYQGNCYVVTANVCDSDGWYCNGETAEQRVHSCSGGSCTYTVYTSVDCNLSDGWYSSGDCTEEYQDYTCTGAGSCSSYTVTNTRNKPNGTSCSAGTGVCKNGSCCIPDWKCTGWLPTSADCGQELFQTQTCTDKNNCDTNLGKPAESQTVIGTRCPSPACSYSSVCDNTGDRITYSCNTATWNCDSSTETNATICNRNTDGTLCGSEEKACRYPSTCDAWNRKRTCSAGSCSGAYTWTSDTSDESACQGQSCGTNKVCDANGNCVTVVPPENCCNAIDDDLDGLENGADPDCAVDLSLSAGSNSVCWWTEWDTYGSWRNYYSGWFQCPSGYIVDKVRLTQYLGAGDFIYIYDKHNIERYKSRIMGDLLEANMFPYYTNKIKFRFTSDGTGGDGVYDGVKVQAILCSLFPFISSPSCDSISVGECNVQVCPKGIDDSDIGVDGGVGRYFTYHETGYITHTAYDCSYYIPREDARYTEFDDAPSGDADMDLTWIYSWSKSGDQLTITNAMMAKNAAHSLRGGYTINPGTCKFSDCTTDPKEMLYGYSSCGNPETTNTFDLEYCGDGETNCGEVCDASNLTDPNKDNCKSDCFGLRDTTPPETTLTAYSPDPTSDNTPTYSGITTDTLSNVVDIEYRVDGGSWNNVDLFTPSQSVSFTFTTSALSDGIYTIEVRAQDEIGNWETTYPSDTLTIDTTPPTSEITGISPEPGYRDGNAFLRANTEGADKTYTVTVADSDNPGGSGLDACYIYVTDNVTGISALRTRTCNSSASFTVGNTGDCQNQENDNCSIWAYSKDKAGNEEIIKTMPADESTYKTAEKNWFNLGVDWTPPSVK